MDLGSCWVLEADIEAFFGSVDPARLREILHQRVQDGVLLRLIGKWLKAGVMEEGRVYRPETGVPQGARSKLRPTGFHALMGPVEERPMGRDAGERMHALLEVFPLPRPRVVHSVVRTAANP